MKTDTLHHDLSDPHLPKPSSTIKLLTMEVPLPSTPPLTISRPPPTPQFHSPIQTPRLHKHPPKQTIFLATKFHARRTSPPPNRFLHHLSTMRQTASYHRRSPSAYERLTAPAPATPSTGRRSPTRTTFPRPIAARVGIAALLCALMYASAHVFPYADVSANNTYTVYTRMSRVYVTKLALSDTLRMLRKTCSGGL